MEEIKHTSYSESSKKQKDEQTVITPVAKRTFPMWAVFLFLFLGSIILGMGMYIAILQQASSNISTSPESVSPTNSPMPSASGSVTPGPDWKTYRDEQAGFTLQYPPTVVLNESEKGSPSMVLNVSVDALDAIPVDLPLDMGRASALADKAALEKGVAQTVGDFVATDALVRIGNTYNARMTSVLSRFEVCSVIFSRKIVFYPNNFRVMISLSGQEEAIIPSMPDFFLVDEKNCGQNSMWNRDRMGTFMPTLAKGEGKGEGQLWYDTFTAIAKTITLIPTTQKAAAPAVYQTGSRTCEVSDPDFCTRISDIQTKMYAYNFAGLLDFQQKTTVTCDPDGMAIAICEGAPKGAVKTGYAIGYNQSEGSVQEQYQYISSIQSYIRENGPFEYNGSIQSGDKGMIVYLDKTGTFLFVFPMIRESGVWKFRSILLGQTFEESEYSNLSPALLENIR